MKSTNDELKKGLEELRQLIKIENNMVESPYFNLRPEAVEAAENGNPLESDGWILEAEYPKTLDECELTFPMVKGGNTFRCVTGSASICSSEGSHMGNVSIHIGSTSITVARVAEFCGTFNEEKEGPNPMIEFLKPPQDVAPILADAFREAYRSLNFDKHWYEIFYDYTMALQSKIEGLYEERDGMYSDEELEYIRKEVGKKLLGKEGKETILGIIHTSFLGLKLIMNGDDRGDMGERVCEQVAYELEQSVPSYPRIKKAIREYFTYSISGGKVKYSKVMSSAIGSYIEDINKVSFNLPMSINIPAEVSLSGKEKEANFTFSLWGRDTGLFTDLGYQNNADGIDAIANNGEPCGLTQFLRRWKDEMLSLAVIDGPMASFSPIPVYKEIIKKIIDVHHDKVALAFMKALKRWKPNDNSYEKYISSFKGVDFKDLYDTNMKIINHGTMSFPRQEFEKNMLSSEFFDDYIANNVVIREDGTWEDITDMGGIVEAFADIRILFPHLELNEENLYTSM